MTDLARELETTCIKLENAIVETIMKGVPPPNAPSTIKRKRSSHTLIDKGNLVGSITHKIIIHGNELQGEVGIFDPEIAYIGFVHEFGRGRNPERSFMRSTFDDKGDQLMDELEQKIGDQIARWEILR